MNVLQQQNMLKKMKNSKVHENIWQSNQNTQKNPERSHNNRSPKISFVCATQSSLILDQEMF